LSLKVDFGKELVVFGNFEFGNLGG